MTRTPSRSRTHNPMRRRRPPVAWALAAALASCADDPRVAPLAERGAALASDPRVTRSQYNPFACTTCHPVRAGSQGGVTLPGAPLQGAARRPSFWGGEVVRMREAVERCWVNFMRGAPEDLDGPDGRAIDAWLLSLAPEGSTEGTAPVPRTWPRTVRDLGPGDRTRGQAVWNRACSHCHGAIGTGEGRIGPAASVIPRDTIREHCNRDFMSVGYPDRQSYIRATVTEKTRHGSFLGYAGVMPPFANEVLSDDEMRDLTAFFECPP